MAITVAQIIGLLAEMILEDSRQPAITEQELPHLLEECLRAFEYETQWKRNSAMESLYPGNTGPKEPRTGPNRCGGFVCHSFRKPSSHMLRAPLLMAAHGTRCATCAVMAEVAAEMWSAVLYEANGQPVLVQARPTGRDWATAGLFPRLGRAAMRRGSCAGAASTSQNACAEFRTEGGYGSASLDGPGLPKISR